MQATRSLTPQPWHPDYQRDGSRSSTPNPLDLPEHRRGQYSGSEYDMSVIDLYDDNEKNEKSNNNKNNKSNHNNSNNINDNNNGTVLNKTRKNFLSRFRRLRVKKISSGDGKVGGTGRVAQFSNERLYLHWIRFGILQGSIAVTLLSFGEGIPAYVGVVGIILALLTLIYATTLYHLRHLYMITKRQDIDYQQKVIPTLICVGLILLYATNLILNLVIGKPATSTLPYDSSQQDNFGHYF
ncbi:vacuolar transporter chaperone [Mortierella sp. AD094]|nr:vacuolar transporter chaperone [Mortierella sp. AD094]